MENSEFINNLKNAIESGDFNSDASKKINDIVNTSDGIKYEDARNHLMNIIKSLDVNKNVNIVDYFESESEYMNYLNNEYHEELLENDINKLILLDTKIHEKIIDLFKYIDELNNKYNVIELNSNDNNLNRLIDLINKIKSKYKSIIL